MTRKPTPHWRNVTDMCFASDRDLYTDPGPSGVPLHESHGYRIRMVDPHTMLEETRLVLIVERLVQW